MMLVDEWIFERIVVVAEVDDRIGGRSAVLHSKQQGKIAGNALAPYNLQRYDFDFAAELLALAYLLDEVGFHPVRVQISQQYCRDTVVKLAFSVKTGTLDAVVGEGHILVSEDDLIGIVSSKYLLFVPVEQ
jgi:hypothetical protein